jgi:hypothetical protein
MSTSNFACRISTTILAVLLWIVNAQGQGTVTFNDAAGFAGTNYYESGIGFNVGMPGVAGFDRMGVIAGGFNVPINSTPYMVFFNQNTADNYVFFSLTNGSTFGLISVQLADASSPSYTAYPIEFIGYTPRSIVTQIFTTPGNGTDSLSDYQFSPDFGSGLMRVDIITHINRQNNNPAHWAMDNLVVVVPEPDSFALIAIGLLFYPAWKRTIGSESH